MVTDCGSCGHWWCDVCAGYVDPNTRVLFSKPNPTVWCNRRPNALKSYTQLFVEIGSDKPRLTDAVKRVIPPTLIGRWQNADRPTKDFNIQTKTGWDQPRVGRSCGQ